MVDMKFWTPRSLSSSDGFSDEEPEAPDRAPTSATNFSMVPNGKVLLLYAFFFVYGFAWELQDPLGPYLVERLVGKGERAVLAYGHLMSFFCGAQLFGSLLAGYILDVGGVRLGFALTWIAGAAQYLLLSVSTNIWVLYLSKVPGVLMCGGLCTSAGVAMLTRPGTERINALAFFFVPAACASLISPALGGIIFSRYGYVVGARVAMTVSLLALIPTPLLPGKTAQDGKVQAPPGGARQWAGDVATVLRCVGAMPCLWLTMSFIHGAQVPAIALVLKNTFGLSMESLGLCQSVLFSGGSFAAFAVMPLWGWLFGTNFRKCMATMLALAAVVCFVQLAAMTVLLRVHVQLALFTFLAGNLAAGILGRCLHVTMNAWITGVIPKDTIGTYTALSSAVNSVSFIFAPTLGASLLASGGASTLYTVCCCAIVALAGLWPGIARTLPPNEAGFCLHEAAPGLASQGAVDAFLAPEDAPLEDALPAGTLSKAQGDAVDSPKDRIRQFFASV